MKKVTVLLTYENQKFYSDTVIIGSLKLKRLRDFIINAVAGELSHFEMKSNNEEVFFTRQILSKSIITLIVDDID